MQKKTDDTDPRIMALRASAMRRLSVYEDRLWRAINKLESENKTINTSSVSREAGVSRGVVYRHKDVADYVSKAVYRHQSGQTETEDVKQTAAGK